MRFRNLVVVFTTRKMNKMCVRCGEIKPAEELITTDDSRYGHCSGYGCDRDEGLLSNRDYE